jgi:hypothetical protein
MVVFENVKSVFLPSAKGIQNVLSASNQTFGVVVVKKGTILCSGIRASCFVSADPKTDVVLDLKGELLNHDKYGLQVD